MTRDGDATVLVVEDEPDLADLFTTFLSTEHAVRTATSGQEAIEVADDDVDVVLLDRRMPGMSGDEVLATFSERGIDAQVAMLTGVDADLDVVDMPFDAYWTKPIDRDELLALVDVLLQRAAYDERSQEFFSLASKKVALERAGNDDTEEYRELIDRMEAVRGAIDETLDGLSVGAGARDPPRGGG